MGIPSDQHASSQEDPVAALASVKFGIGYLFSLQRMAVANIPDAIESDSPVRQLVLFPTGFGKSLCFHLPALVAAGPTVVVYPLLALMNDQKNSLDRRGIPSVLFRGGLEDGEWSGQCATVKSGKAKIVITNPESLATPRLRDFLAGAKILHLAIDEAHCVSEWGETFRQAHTLVRDKAKLLIVFDQSRDGVKNIAGAINSPARSFLRLPKASVKHGNGTRKRLKAAVCLEKIILNYAKGED